MRPGGPPEVSYAPRAASRGALTPKRERRLDEADHEARLARGNLREIDRPRRRLPEDDVARTGTTPASGVGIRGSDQEVRETVAVDISRPRDANAREVARALPALAYSPYQNGKQEHFWAVVEGRLLAMLRRIRDLTASKNSQIDVTRDGKGADQELDCDGNHAGIHFRCSEDPGPGPAS